MRILHLSGAKCSAYMRAAIAFSKHVLARVFVEEPAVLNEHTEDRAPAIGESEKVRRTCTSQHRRLVAAGATVREKRPCCRIIRSSSRRKAQFDQHSTAVRVRRLCSRAQRKCQVSKPDNKFGQVQLAQRLTAVRAPHGCRRAAALKLANQRAGEPKE